VSELLLAICCLALLAICCLIRTLTDWSSHAFCWLVLSCLYI